MFACIKGEVVLGKVTIQDRIISAAIELVNEKGYKGATTRLIAERAEVNEVTLFRHFGNKRGIIEAAIQKYSPDDLLHETFKKRVTWNIHSDLQMIVREYQHVLEGKRDVILISLKESGVFPELDQMIARIPLAYKAKLMGYFSEMIKRGEIASVNIETVSTQFMFLSFGYFMLKSRLNPVEEVITLDEFIDQHLTLFINSIV